MKTVNLDCQTRRPTRPSVWTIHERGKERLTVAFIRYMDGRLVCNTFSGPMRLLAVVIQSLKDLQEYRQIADDGLEIKNRISSTVSAMQSFSGGSI
jgi:hypothetical protein